MNKWDDIIPSLVNNCYNDNKIFRLSSLETLGFICEEITSKVLKPGEIEQILSAYLTNLKEGKDEEILIITLKAFLNSISLSEKIFSVPVNLLS